MNFFFLTTYNEINNNYFVIIMEALIKCRDSRLTKGLLNYLFDILLQPH